MLYFMCQLAPQLHVSVWFFFRPSGLKYEKAKEWKIPCVNAQWLCDILLGNFEALRQIQHSRYSIYTHPEPLVPNLQLVQNLLGMDTLKQFTSLRVTLSFDSCYDKH